MEKPRRTVRKSSSSVVPRKSASKKALAKRASERSGMKVVQTVSSKTRAQEARRRQAADAAKVAKTPERKAPTPLASTAAERRQKKKQIFVVVTLILLGIGTSAAVGFVDSGQIDINAVVEARNERLLAGNATENDTLVSEVAIPVQNTTNSGKADGGLRGLGSQVKKPSPPPVVSTSTATSSDLMASSTDSVASSTETIASSTDEVTEETVSEDALPEEEEVIEEESIEEAESVI